MGWVAISWIGIGRMRGRGGVWGWFFDCDIAGLKGGEIKLLLPGASWSKSARIDFEIGKCY